MASDQIGDAGLQAVAFRPTELGLMRGLRRLKFPLNLLSGTIPSEIGQLTNIFELVFPPSMLSGSIPTELWALTLLKQFHFGDGEGYANFEEQPSMLF